MTTSKANINERDVIAYKCLKSLGFCTRFFFKQKEGRKFIMARHHEIIIDALEKVIRGETTRLIINLPPRFGKTEIAVKHFIAHCLALNPKSKFIHLSYSDTLALDNSEQAKDLVSSEYYREIFPHVRIKKGSDSKQKWYTTDGGGVYATSTSGQVTGFGAGTVEDEEKAFDEFLGEIEHKQEFSGAIIIDDPIKPDDADSETLRNKVNNKFDSTIRSRTNSRKTPIIVIMQRVHLDDLSGYLQKIEPDVWTVISLPALNPDGTALWPHKMNEDECRRLREANEDVWNKQYMQNPQELKGLLWPRAELRYFNPNNVKNFESCIAYVDVADEGVDYLSCPFGQNIGSDIYITKVVFSQENSDITIPLIVPIAKELKCTYIRVESNSGGAQYSRDLRKQVHDDCTVLAVPNSANKHTRILMQSGFVKKNFVFLEEEFWDQDYRNFMNHVYKYLKNGTEKKDDGPDSLAGLANFIQSIFLHLYQ